MLLQVLCFYDNCPCTNAIHKCTNVNAQFQLYRPCSLSVWCLTKGLKTLKWLSHTCWLLSHGVVHKILETSYFFITTFPSNGTAGNCKALGLSKKRIGNLLHVQTVRRIINLRCVRREKIKGYLPMEGFQTVTERDISLYGFTLFITAEDSIFIKGLHSLMMLYYPCDWVIEPPRWARAIIIIQLLLNGN